MSLIIRNCDFSYGFRSAVVENLNHEISPGRTALLGPNGAGKSTLLGLCANILTPSHGTIALDGLDPAKTQNQYRRAVAWLPQTVSTFPGLRAREYIAYCGWLKGMTRRDAWDRSAAALQTVDLTNHATTPAKNLSGGQLRRLGVAAALVHDARVILLDEPTAGLDPNQRDRLRAALKRIPDEVHLVVSTHDITDIDALFDRVTVMTSGEIVFDGTTRSFMMTGGSSGATAAYSALVEAE